MPSTWGHLREPCAAARRVAAPPPPPHRVRPALGGGAARARARTGGGEGVRWRSEGRARRRRPGGVCCSAHASPSSAASSSPSSSSPSSSRSSSPARPPRGSSQKVSLSPRQRKLAGKRVARELAKRSAPPAPAPRRPTPPSIDTTADGPRSRSRRQVHDPEIYGDVDAEALAALAALTADQVAGLALSLVEEPPPGALGHGQQAGQVQAQAAADEATRRLKPAAVSDEQLRRLLHRTAADCAVAPHGGRVAADGFARQSVPVRQAYLEVQWALASLGCRAASDDLWARAALPFRVEPQVFPELTLEGVEAEVELLQEEIWLENEQRWQEESRLTAWQSEAGVPFKYSGKVMQPAAGGLSRGVLAVRDALAARFGTRYDSVLVNYYRDGKSGMRFHSDPLYATWDDTTAVVSVGAARSFILRAVGDFSERYAYRVRSGDVVVMSHTCQERFQHCVKVEPRAADAGPRISLVFKKLLAA